MVIVPFSVNLLALLARLSSDCRKRVWSAWIVPRSAVAIDDEAVAVLRRHRLDRLGHVLDHGHQRERFEMKLHPPCLDLGQVENVVDQGEQVPARAEHAVERLEVLLQRLRILPQHLADADDGVERRAQLVAHVGEELRLVLARLGELPALILDFVEQPHVLDGIAAWSAKVEMSSICLSLNGRTALRIRARTPIAVPSRSIGTAERWCGSRQVPGTSERVFRIGAHIRDVNHLPSSSARPVAVPRSSGIGCCCMNRMNSPECS